MFQKHGSHGTVCEALLNKLDDETAGVEQKIEDQNAAWGRFGLDPKAMEKAKKAKRRGGGEKVCKSLLMIAS